MRIRVRRTAQPAYALSTGATSFGGNYYRGPSKTGATCTFKLYALSGRLELPRGASRDEVMKAMRGKVLDKATFSAVL